MRILLGLLFAACISSAHGASEIVSTVDTVRVDNNGWAFIRFTSPLGMEPASCIQDHPNHLSFDTKTDAGKAILSLALTAHSTGKRIFARGTDTCEGYGVIENWNFGWITND